MKDGWRLWSRVWRCSHEIVRPCAAAADSRCTPPAPMNIRAPASHSEQWVLIIRKIILQKFKLKNELMYLGNIEQFVRKYWPLQLKGAIWIWRKQNKELWVEYNGKFRVTCTNCTSQKAGILFWESLCMSWWWHRHIPCIPGPDGADTLAPLPSPPAPAAPGISVQRHRHFNKPYCHV